MDNKPEVIDPSELLTLCMPTYNRVVNVCEALEDIIPKIRPYNFRLIVVDNCSPDNTRKVVEAALSSRAAGIVLAHNHPQGFAIPSDRDVATTIRLVEGLAVINVAVYDHIIVADNDYVSLAQSKQYRNIFQPHRRKDL